MCEYCRGTGSVAVWDRQTMCEARQAARGMSVEIQWRTAYVQCRCQRSRRTWVRKRGRDVRHIPLPCYNSDKWVRVDQGREALLEWAKNYRLPNYENFGEYAGN